jgi:recombinase, phage recT family
MSTNTAKLKAAAQGSLQTAQTRDLKTVLASPAVTGRINEVLGKKAAAFSASLLQVCRSNALLQQAEPMSVIAAAMTAATLDLPLNQSLGFAYIVPFRNGKTGHQEAQFQIGYKGFIQLAMRSGQMKRIVAEPIYEAQIISRNPIKGYEFDFDRQPEKHEAPAGYYAYMELINGFTAEAYMTVAQIQEHAARYSQTAKKGYGVWKDNFDAMALKTVLKKLLTKYAPMSVEMQQAVISDQAVIHDIPPEGDIINHSEVFDYADNHENGGQPAETAPDEAERADAQGIPEAEFAKLCEAVSTGETDFETAAKTPNLSQVQRDTLESL